MSTEIKNTLFRFVTMRAPELLTEADMKSGFIHRKPVDPEAEDPEIREFEDAVTAGALSGLSKWQLMVDCAETYTPLTKSEIINLHEFMHDFGVWISKNKYKNLESTIISKADYLGTPLTVEKENLLWDNLFYQVVTQKDFQAKEAIIQMLTANYVVEKIAPGPPYKLIVKQLPKSKVVLPKDLFVENDGTTNGSVAKISGNLNSAPLKASQSAPTAEMKKLRENHAAQLKIEEYKSLKKELQKAEKKFKSNYKVAYDEAVTDYNVIITDARKTYLDHIDAAKEDWCTLQGPDFEYDPNNPCNQPTPVRKPTYPDFSFDYDNEMDFTFLGKTISSKGFKSLLTLFEIDFELDVEGNADLSSISDITGEGYTYGQTYTLLDGGISQANQTIITNSPPQNTTVVSVGGVVVPTTGGHDSAPFSYQICPTRPDATHVGFDLKITTPNGTWEVDESASTYDIDGGTSGPGNLSVAAKNGNTILLKTADTHLYSDSTIATVFKASVIFENGAEWKFTLPISLTSNVFKSCFTGFLTEEGGAPAITPTPFIPSGFGFKQIGIADYKKVEQTVQGYVEGDVSHIENIMAREYKEKATRRLRRNENTTTTSRESEKEKLTDTTSTERYEMQTEVANILQQANDFAAAAGVKYTAGDAIIDSNVNTASHSSNEESTMNTVNQVKEITERAMERIVNKVKEERIEKIIEEFEESNKHGFDNTKGDNHVVGVYRWVDKIFKNQIYNYGKRLMFEFMVPQPAKLHLLGMEDGKGNEETLLVKPLDPRTYIDPETTSTQYALTDPSMVNNATADYWAGVFNVELTPKPEDTIYVGTSLSGKGTEIDGGEFDESIAGHAEIKIPEYYQTVSAKGLIHAPNEPAVGYVLLIGGLKSVYPEIHQPMPAFVGSFPVSYALVGYHAACVTVEVRCQLMPGGLKKWQQETFNAIIEAYETALAEYEEKLAAENVKAVTISQENPNFYRQIENLILRKNCISYLMDQNQSAQRTYGKDMFRPITGDGVRNFMNHEIKVSPALDDYTAFAKFLEQAFEWEIMSYNFYPYYWGNRDDWKQLYQYDNNDPLFRNFMQAGMARVIVTVRPGFEEAVRFYMQTGLIWNGGEVPVIEDDLFMSIVDELRAPTGVKIGKAWPTRVPTSLTILQAQSIGLNVEHPLPTNTDLSDFENPDEVPVSEALETTNYLLGMPRNGKITGKIFGADGVENIKIGLYSSDEDEHILDITYSDENGNWEFNNLAPGVYRVIIDENNDLPESEYEITEGEKETIVEIFPLEASEVVLAVQLIEEE